MSEKKTPKLTVKKLLLRELAPQEMRRVVGGGVLKVPEKIGASNACGALKQT